MINIGINISQIYVQTYAGYCSYTIYCINNIDYINIPFVKLIGLKVIIS